jgi:hypothetical protein
MVVYTHRFVAGKAIPINDNNIKNNLGNTATVDLETFVL